MIKNKEKLNVFFVFTPLQALIALSVINKENLKKIKIISFSEGTNKTHIYCVRLFSKKAEIINININKNIKIILSFLKIMFLKNDSKKFKIVFFTGSIKSIYSRFFLAKIKEEVKINTFDDGCGNIVLDGYFSKGDRKFKVFFMGLFGVIEKYEEVLMRINKHYSIYSLPNVYDSYCKSKVLIDIPLSLASSIDGIFIPESNKIKILLTQPYSERNLITVSEEIDLYNSAVSKFSITHCMRHPAEKKVKIKNINIINTEYIAEELVIALAAKHEVEVYAFGSTALLNLMNVPNVKCIWLVSGFIGQPVPDSIASLEVFELPRI